MLLWLECTASESEQVTLSCQHHRAACGEMWFIPLEVMKLGPKGPLEREEMGVG